MYILIIAYRDQERHEYARRFIKSLWGDSAQCPALLSIRALFELNLIPGLSPKGHTEV